MATDDGIRAKKGLVAYLRRLDDKTMRLIFDHVEADTEISPKSWRHFCFNTFNDYDAEDLKNLRLTQKDFASIGENLIISLLALNKTLE